MALDTVGSWGSLVFVLVLAASQVANWVGPPAPTVRVVAWTALAMWLFVPLAAWLDAHREPSFDLAPGPARRRSRGSGPLKDTQDR
jgi:hypothetical protein